MGVGHFNGLQTNDSSGNGTVNSSPKCSGHLHFQTDDWSEKGWVTGPGLCDGFQTDLRSRSG